MNLFKNLLAVLVFAIVIGVSFIAINTDASAQSCLITLTKSADPPDNTVFTFNVVSGDGDIEFQLLLSDPNSKGAQIDTGLDLSITEEPLQGWQLVDVECIAAGGGLDFSIEGPTVSINCLDEGGEISCLYTNVQVASQVPTLSEWGLIAMASILGIVGFLVARRRKVTA